MYIYIYIIMDDEESAYGVRDMCGGGDVYGLHHEEKHEATPIHAKNTVRPPPVITGPKTRNHRPNPARDPCEGDSWWFRAVRARRELRGNVSVAQPLTVFSSKTGSRRAISPLVCSLG